MYLFTKSYIIFFKDTNSDFDTYYRVTDMYNTTYFLLCKVFFFIFLKKISFINKRALKKIN